MATEKRLIDANEAKKKLRAVREWFVGHPSSEQDKLAQAVVKLCIEEIEKVKPADAVEVVHAKWVKKIESKLDTYTGEYWEEEYFSCPICGKDSDAEHNFCPNCGAKMDAERRTDNG